MVNVTKRYLGTSTENERVYLDVRITTATRAAMTITHDPIAEYFQLSMQGAIHEVGGPYGGYRCVSSGQCGAAIAAMSWKDDGLYGAAEIAKILAVWERWHLNDLRPYCEHQTRIRYTTEDAAVETAKCPRGYAYGSAWLVEPLPVEIIDKLAGWFGEKA